MPLSSKDKKLKKNFTKEYGEEGGKRVFYATLNKHISKGKPINVPESKRLAARRKHKKRHRRAKRKA